MVNSSLIDGGLMLGLSSSGGSAAAFPGGAWIAVITGSAMKTGEAPDRSSDSTTPKVTDSTVKSPTETSGPPTPDSTASTDSRGRPALLTGWPPAQLIPKGTNRTVVSALTLARVKLCLVARPGATRVCPPSCHNVPRITQGSPSGSSQGSLSVPEPLIGGASTALVSIAHPSRPSAAVACGPVGRTLLSWPRSWPIGSLKLVGRSTGIVAGHSMLLGTNGPRLGSKPSQPSSANPPRRCARYSAIPSTPVRI